MLRKGFTLIELLIVITIIAILSGAAIPYVQDYVDDARFAKAKADIDEIRNALIRYETDRGDSYNATGTAALVGPYLQSSLVDPWGSTYAISTGTSRITCAGPDRIAGNGDDILVDFRPPLALTKVYWEDTVVDGVVGIGDSLILNFTRPVDPTSNPSGAAFKFNGTAQIAGVITPPVPADYSTTGRSVKVVLGASYVIGSIVPGKTVLGIVDPSAVIKDYAGTFIRTANDAIIKAR